MKKQPLPTYPTNPQNKTHPIPYKKKKTDNAMKKKMLIIVNPISGVGRQKKIERLLRNNLNQDLYDYKTTKRKR